MTRLLMLLALIGLPQLSYAHCEIPCGVYDDGARFDSMLEHAKTIEKSMDEINDLSKAEAPNIHDIARWTMNKEEHANKIQHIISQYFLTQRVKAPAKDAAEATTERYISQLKSIHHIITAAMKAKQSTDIARVETLREAIEAYKALYFSEHGHAH